MLKLEEFIKSLDYYMKDGCEDYDVCIGKEVNGKYQCKPLKYIDVDNYMKDSLGEIVLLEDDYKCG